MKKQTILNSAGEPITLNAMEQRIVDVNQKKANELGFQIDITSLTTIMKKITEQKFFEIAPADYIPVRVGEGAWSTSLETYRSYSVGDDFTTGIVNTGASNSRLAAADTAIDSLNVPVLNWAKSIGWSVFDLQHATKSGNWDLVTSKEKSRKKNWDLGIQKVAFLGTGQSNCLGLYNQSGITTNTTVIPQPIVDMTTAEFDTFIRSLLGAYRANCNHTAWPTHLVIPESDYTGLASPTNSDFPLKSTLEVIQDTLRIMTRNPNFQVLPNAYGQSGLSGLAANRYILLNHEEESLRMDIPVDYTSTLANSLDSFNFQNVGYGQFTGVLAYRPLELMYFDNV